MHFCCPPRTCARCEQLLAEVGSDGWYEWQSVNLLVKYIHGNKVSEFGNYVSDDNKGLTRSRFLAYFPYFEKIKVGV
jgi:hypothetical protein